MKVPHWRLTAILRVHKTFVSHEEAAIWYLEQKALLPSNCMVKDNPPSTIEHVAPITEFKSDIRKWDLSYIQRARKTPIFHACVPEFLELNVPPVITREAMSQVFGRIPGTQNPPSITMQQFSTLKSIVGISA